MKINRINYETRILEEPQQKAPCSLYSKIKEFFWKPFSHSSSFQAKKEPANSRFLNFFSFFRHNKKTKVYAIFNKILNNKEISTQEKEKIGIFIIENIDKKKEIEYFDAYLKKHKIDTSDEKNEIFLLVHHLFHFLPTNGKCLPYQKALEKLKKIDESSENLPVKDRLSLTDYNELEYGFKDIHSRYSNLLVGKNCSSLKDLLDNFQLFFSEEAKKTLLSKISFFEEIKKPYQVYQQSLKNSISQFISYYQTGDISLSISKREDILYGDKFDLGISLKNRLITPYGHAVKFYRNEVNTLKKTHVFNQLEGDFLMIDNFLASEIYRLNPSQLIQEDKWEILKNLSQEKGMSVDEYLKKTYENAENKIQKSAVKNLKSIHNSAKRRVAAGVADFLPHGHTRKKERKDNFEKIYALFMGEKEIKSKKMICSEYAAKATIAALIEFDKQLESDLTSYLSKESPYSKDKIRFLKSKGRLFIHLPFSDKERLRTIHPGRLIKILQKKGCLERVEPHPLLKKYFMV